MGSHLIKLFHSCIPICIAGSITGVVFAFSSYHPFPCKQIHKKKSITDGSGRTLRNILVLPVFQSPFPLSIVLQMLSQDFLTPSCKERQSFCNQLSSRGNWGKRVRFCSSSLLSWDHRGSSSEGPCSDSGTPQRCSAWDSQLSGCGWSPSCQSSAADACRDPCRRAERQGILLRTYLVEERCDFISTWVWLLSSPWASCSHSV